MDYDGGSPWQRQGDHVDYSVGRWQPHQHRDGHGASSSPEDAGKGNSFVHRNQYGDGEYGNGSDGSYHIQSQGGESAWFGKKYERASSQDNYRQGSSSPAGDATSGRKRRSRWEPQPDSDANEKEDSGSKKRKSRWAAEEPKILFPNVNLPPFMTGVELDPEMQALNIKLLDLNRRLQMGQLFYEKPDAPRSPSPEPIYDNMGIRINTREFRARERLTRERHELISEMIKRNPHFKPPPDYKPPKLQKKLFIPAKDFPGYNFIGLIIGPRGNTQKRMEKETGAKIVIRGKGSVKEGRTQQKRDVKPDPSENEDLHVLVEADTEEALEAAAGMVEKLLQPVEEGRNEHKRAQLRELAALNGTIRDDESCRQCGQLGHRQYCCPEKNTTFKAGVVCAKCGDGGHPTSDCTQKGPVAGNKMDGEYQKFLVEVNADGGGDSTVGRQTGPSLLLGGPQGSNGAAGAHPGLGSKKEPDDTNLYVGYLPATYEDDALKRLFSSFGQIDEVKVIKDRATGASKGYGFVKFADAACAAQAVLHMNGWKLEDKTLAVRVAGRPPVPAGSPFGPGYPSFPRGPDGACMPPPPPPPPWGPGPPPFNPYAPQFPLAPPGTVPPPPPYNGYPGPPGVPFPVGAVPPPPGFSPSHGATSAQDPFQAPPGTDFASGAPGSAFPPYPPYPGYYATPPASVPPPWTSSNDNPSNQVESEYERFMSEMKMQ